MNFLKVDGTDVVNGKGDKVVLRGAGLGGSLNMENFITGYPGHEHAHHAAMRKAIGSERYDRFFSRFVRAFWSSSDAKFFRSLGLNCLRVPFNYRHFEDDMEPFVLKKNAFAALDHIVETCAQEKIYTILDLHAAQGYQNQDWHSDNPTSHAFLWEHKQFQDRVVWLWQQIAAHYRDNEWVAGYNLLNEPADPEHVRLVALYERLEKEVRKIDPRHILWLDGNTYAMDFSAFKANLPNTVYGCHDYSTYGFPFGEKYTGSAEQKEKLQTQFGKKIAFMKKHQTPIWNGEFGPVYANAKYDGDGFQGINNCRIAMLKEQLRIYEKDDVHWNIWLYKDIGLQGMIHVAEDSKWLQTIGKFLAKKNALMADRWGTRPNPEVVALFQPMSQYIESNSRAAQSYPETWSATQHLSRIIRSCLLSDGLQDEFAELFSTLTDAELDACADSFAFENCVQRKELNDVLRQQD